MHFRFIESGTIPLYAIFREIEWISSNTPASLISARQTLYIYTPFCTLFCFVIGNNPFPNVSLLYILCKEIFYRYMLLTLNLTFYLKIFCIYVFWVYFSV